MGAISCVPRMAWLCGPLGHIRNLFSYLELRTFHFFSYKATKFGKKAIVMTIRNRGIRRKGFGASVGSRNLANYIGRNRKGEIKERELFSFVERIVPITTKDRSRVMKVFRTLIAYVMEVYDESGWTLPNVAELGKMDSYEEIKDSIKDMEKEEGRTMAVKMFELYHDTWKPEKHYDAVCEEIERLVKQYLLLEV